MKASDTPSHTSPGAEGWKDVLQLLKEQSAKMEKLARALSVIQQGMLRHNPDHVKDSVNEASEVLSAMLNSHKCPLESGVEIQKKLQSHPTQKIWVSSGDCALRLWEIPQKSRQRGRRGLLLLLPKIGFPRKGRAAYRHPTLRPPGARPQKRMGNGSWWRRKRRKKREEERG